MLEVPVMVLTVSLSSKSSQTLSVHVGFKVLTVAVLKGSASSNVTPCSPLKVNRHLGEICHLHL
jgi:hypothetical protein